MAELVSHDLPDAEAEALLEGMVRLATHLAETPIAAISLIEGDRRWFKARVGIGCAWTPRDGSLCTHVLAPPGRPLVIPDAARDARGATDLLVSGPSQIRFYAAVPLIAPAGEVIGTLLVMDRAPREPRPDLLDTLQVLAGAVVAALQLRRDISKAELEAGTDALTGLPNRLSFIEAVGRAIARQRRDGQPISILRIDCDDLHAINEASGGTVGDKLLSTVARTIQLCIREEDMPARLGDDDFAILLVGGDGAEAALVGERVRSAIEATMSVQRQLLTVSIGGVCCHAPPDAEADLLDHAEQMLEQARRGGGNRVRVADRGDAPSGMTEH